MDQERNKLCFVATIPEVVNAFLRTHIIAAAQYWQVTVVCHPLNAALLADLDIRVIPLAFERKAAPWRDLVSLWQLIRLFRRERYDLVHSIMPKTGLLAMLAASVAGVPHRLHTFTGQVWSNMSGLRRLLLRFLDKSIVNLSTQVIIDSPSQRQFLIGERVLLPGQGIVINQGSICGVDIHKFSPSSATRLSVRKEMHIGENQLVVLYLGRMTRDKGIADLVKAFCELVNAGGDLVLLLAGPEEDMSFSEIRSMARRLASDCAARIHCTGYTTMPERYMQAADIFCLPSYREGFGQVIIEAASCEVPAVASRIYGVIDAVAEGESGLLFEAGNVGQLTHALKRMIADMQLRRQMGAAARQRVISLFSSDKITAEMQKVYKHLLENAGACQCNRTPSINN